MSQILEHKDINEYLKNVENRKKKEEKKEEEKYLKHEFFDNDLIKPQEKPNEQNEEEKKQLDEINEFLLKQQKNISNIKDSGATKELKQYLRKMATQKKGFMDLNNEVLNEFDEISDPDSPIKKKEKKEPEKKNLSVKKHRPVPTNHHTPHEPIFKKQTLDKGTMVQI